MIDLGHKRGHDESQEGPNKDEESAEKLHARRVDDVKDNDPEPLSEELMWRAAEAECQQLQPRYGLHMKWLIAWDVGVFAILVVLFAPNRLQMK